MIFPFAGDIAEYVKQLDVPILRSTHLESLKKLPVQEALMHYINMVSLFWDKEKVVKYFPEGDVPFKERFQWINSTHEFIFHSENFFYLYHFSPNINYRYLLANNGFSDLVLTYVQRASTETSIELYELDEAIIFPNGYCSLGCPHCRFHSSPEPDDLSKKPPDMYLSSVVVNKFIKLVNQMDNIKSISIGGGGEPMEEENSVFAIIQNTRVQHISLISGAPWANSIRKVMQFFRKIELEINARLTPLKFDLNISIDSGHIVRQSKFNPDYIDNILQVYWHFKKQNRLTNTLLHIRSLSLDGNINTKDALTFAVDQWSKAHKLQKFNDKPNKNMLYFDEELILEVSYNPFDIRKKEAWLNQLFEDINADCSGFSWLDKLFINFDGKVSMGKYYAAIPLGNLNSNSSEEIMASVKGSFLYRVLKSYGFKEMFRHIKKYVQQPNEYFKGLYFVTELMAKVSADDKLLANVILSFMRDHQDFSGSLGAVEYDIDSVDKFPLDTERRRNWGLVASNTMALGLPEYISCNKSSLKNEFDLLNPLWDTVDDHRRSRIIENLANIRSVQPLIGFIKREFGRRYGSTPKILSIYLAGSYAYLANIRQPGDLDLEVLVDHHELRDACHYLDTFNYEEVFDVPVLAPKSINVWVIDQQFMSKKTNNVIDIDVGFNISRGFPLWGSRFQSSPPPLIERLKVAYFLANLLLTIVHDRNPVLVLKRLIELYAILGQMALIASLSRIEILKSSNISDQDKKEIDAIQMMFKPALLSRQIYSQKIEQSLELLANDSISDEGKFWSENLYEATLAKKNSFALIKELDVLQQDWIKQFPIKESRLNVYRIMSAANPTRVNEHSEIAKVSDLDYSTSVSLASIGAQSPLILVNLERNTGLNTALNDNQKEVIFRAISSNPACDSALLVKIFNDNMDNEFILEGFFDNPCLPQTLFKVFNRQHYSGLKYLWKAQKNKLTDWDVMMVEGLNSNLAELLFSKLKQIESVEEELRLGSNALSLIRTAIRDEIHEIISVDKLGMSIMIERMMPYYNHYMIHAYGRMRQEGEFLLHQVCDILFLSFLYVISASRLSVTQLSSKKMVTLIKIIYRLLSAPAIQGELKYERNMLVHFGWRYQTVDIKLCRAWVDANVIVSGRNDVFNKASKISEAFEKYLSWVAFSKADQSKLTYEVSKMRDLVLDRLLPVKISGSWSAQTLQTRGLFFDALFFKSGDNSAFFRALRRHYPLLKEHYETGNVKHGSIEFHPSGDCNIHCSFCLFGEIRDKHQSLALSAESMCNFISEIADSNSGVDLIQIEIKFGGIFSEPLFDSTWPMTMKGIQTAVLLGFKVGLTTNGINLNSSVAEALIGKKGRSAYYVNISLDAGFPSTWHKLKLNDKDIDKGEKEYQRILDNTRYLVNLRDQTNSSLGIHISYVMQKDNMSVEEINSLLEFAVQARVDSVRFRYPHRKLKNAPQLKQLKNIYEHIEQQKARLVGQLKIIQLHNLNDLFFTKNSDLFGKPQPKTYLNCRVPMLRMTVGSDGLCYPCEHRTYKGGGKLGRVADGYQELLNSDMLKAFSRQVAPIIDSKCDSCAEYDHNLNIVMDLVEEELEYEPQLFSWLENRYKFSNEHQKKEFDVLLQRMKENHELPSTLTSFVHNLLIDSLLKEKIQHIVYDTNFSYENGFDLRNEMFIGSLRQLFLATHGRVEIALDKQTHLHAVLQEFVIERQLTFNEDDFWVLIQDLLTLFILPQTLETVRQVRLLAPAWFTYRTDSPVVTDAVLVILNAHLKARVDDSVFTDIMQTYIVMDIFAEKFKNFLSTSVAENPVVALLLRDSWWLAISLKENRIAPDSEFAKISRFSLLTVNERVEFFRKGLDRAPEVIQLEYIKQGKVFNYLNTAVFVDFAQQAILSKPMPTDKSYSLLELEIIERNAIREIQCSWLMMMVKYIFTLAIDDSEIEVLLEEIYHRDTPEQVKIDLDKHIVFVDSGFKGTLPVMLSAALIWHDMKLKKVSPLLVQCPLRTHVFLYGVEESLSLVIPNAGFRRFGHGGVNQFLEQLPRPIQWGVLTRDGGLSIDESVGNLHLSWYEQWLSAYNNLKDKAKSVYRCKYMDQAIDHIVSIIDADSNSGTIYVFSDLDHVALIPLGFIGSEEWFKRKYSLIPPWKKTEQQKFFEQYREIKQRLYKREAYEVLWDMTLFKEKLQYHLPETKIVFLALSARQEEERDVTRRQLEQMGQWSVFDDILLSQSNLSRKYQIIEEYLRMKRVNLSEDTASIHAFLVLISKNLPLKYFPLKKKVFRHSLKTIKRGLRL